MYPLKEFCRDLGGVWHTLDPVTVKTKSRDGFGISPILRQALAGKSADIVVAPSTKEDLIQVVKAAVKHKIPITPRGGGTANYGQSVPLHGGILLDMARYAGVLWAREGRIRALAGTLMGDIDAVARKSGWELRLHPWDVAAGSLIVEEAGGRITDYRGGRYDLSGAETLASNGRLHAPMRRVLRAAWPAAFRGRRPRVTHAAR